MEDIEECMTINIEALVKAGFINSKNDLSEEELTELRKIIEHAKGLN